MDAKEQLSLFIITKNEAANIKVCLESAQALVGEIIVVDSHSQDGTVQICEQLGAQVFTRDFNGFTDQKNFALSQVTKPWALSLDADETLTPELADEIRTVLNHPDADGYELGRLNSFLGKQMFHGGLKKEYILRLVRTQNAKYEGGLVHEKLVVPGPVKRLEHPFLHCSYTTIETYFEKFNKYTTLAAATLFEKGKRYGVVRILLTPPFEFFRRYILRAGFLDGMRGLIWAAFSSFYTFVKYIKLWYLWQRKQS